MQDVRYFGIGLGTSIWLLIGIFASIFGFQGMKGESYRIWNHFISELGDPRFAPHYRLFNFTLISGGLGLVPFILGWGLTFSTILGKITIGIGLVVAILCALIGVFPEHKEQIHFNVAGLFFIGMAVLIVLISINMLRDPLSRFPIWFAGINAVPCVVALVFIIDTMCLPKWEYLLTYRPWEWKPDRPRFWRNTILEWLSFLSMVGWLLLITGYGIVQSL